MKKRSVLDGYQTYDTSAGFGNPKEWKKTFEKRMGDDEAQSIIDQQKESPHSLLGIPLHASQQEIKKAYRKKMMEWHEDRNPHRLVEAHAMTLRIIAAYTLLYKE